MSIQSTFAFQERAITEFHISLLRATTVQKAPPRHYTHTPNNDSLKQIRFLQTTAGPGDQRHQILSQHPTHRRRPAIWPALLDLSALVPIFILFFTLKICRSFTLHNADTPLESGLLAQALGTMTQLHHLDLEGGTLPSLNPITSLTRSQSLKLLLSGGPKHSSLPLQSTNLTELHIAGNGMWDSVSKPAIGYCRPSPLH